MSRCGGWGQGSTVASVGEEALGEVHGEAAGNPRRVELAEASHLSEAVPNDIRLVGTAHDDRLHFLDWLRLVMVLSVVYAHTAVSGLQGGGGFAERFLIDDVTLFDFQQYRDEVYTGGYHGYNGGRAPYASRWICIIRQWCLPVLFWVSGGAVACSYRGGFPRGVDRLAVFTALGMSLNAGLWFVSPQNKHCKITTAHTAECAGKGLLFDFSICGGAGWWFAILFQMWYTVTLAALNVLNMPFLGATEGSLRPAWLFLQGCINVGVGAFFIIVSGDVCPDHSGAIASLVALEVIFQCLTFMNSPGAGSLAWPDWLPHRLLHYLMALVVVLQFGAVRYADELWHIGPAYLAFISIGFGKFYCLGFLMVYARKGPGGDRVQPLASSCWPVMLIFIAIVSPSTNWELAGMLTFPFFPSVAARCLYVTGSMVMIFCMDRLSRAVRCRPLPDLLATTSLVLYLCHPVLITVILQLGGSDVMAVWLTAMASCFVLVCCKELASRRLTLLARGLPKRSKGSSSELLPERSPSGSDASESSPEDDEEDNSSRDDQPASQIAAGSR